MQKEWYYMSREIVKMTEEQRKAVEKELTGTQIKAIEQAVSKGDRVEVIPVKDGIRLMLVKKNELK